MDKNVRKLRRLIEKTIPYTFHNILLNLSFIAFLIMIFIVIAMAFIKTEPVSFDENNTFTYTYIEVNQVQKLVDQYYVADDGTYVYLYYSDSSDIPVSTSKIVGVPRLIDEDNLEKLIPTFQRLYPDLKVKTIDDLIKYTGNYYFDYTVPALLYDMQIVFVFGCIPFIIWLILLFIKIYYRKCYFNSLQNVILEKEVSRFTEELVEPRVAYSSINALILSDYLVMNHPSPYIIDINHIVWMYTEKKKIFFLFDQKLTLIIYDDQFKKTRVLIASAFSNRNKKEMNELLSFVSQSHSKAIIGYSERNKALFNHLKKDNDVM